jgi:small subunit ribosomal protein S6
MPTYESIFVCPLDLPPEELEELVRKFEKIITQGGGEVISCDKLGCRKLAYEIKGYKEGVMYCLNFNSPPNLIRELEKNYRVTDKVIRHLIVKVDKKKLKEEKVTSEESKAEEGKESPTKEVGHPSG